MSKHISDGGFPTFNSFLTKHDPKGSAYQTMIKKGTGVPGQDRLKAWCKALRLNAEKTQEIMRTADRERVFAAGDGKDLGAGIQVIREDLASLERQLADAIKDKVRLREKLTQILAELDRRGISLEKPSAEV